jgi:ADP-heptose:LPS heptosyltransferase
VGTRTIRFLDYWIGVPLCLLLTACRFLVRERTAPPRKILFLKFIEQGATVLAQDAMRRATASVGRDHIYFCVFQSNRAILDLLGTVPPANIFAIRDSRLDRCLLDFLRALIAIRKSGVDTVIDMEFFSRASAIFSFLSGASTRVGLHRFTGELPYRGDLMTHRVQYNPHLHVSVQYSVLVEAAHRDPSDTPMLKVPLAQIALCGDTAGPSFRFTPTAAETDGVRRLLPSTAGPVVLINPNASDLLPLRKWQGARFIELSQQILAAHPRASIVVTGAPSEEAGAAQVCAAIASPRAISLAGQTTLRELLTLYSLADVLVTNDSGPAHFASLTPIHTVVLFGPETPRLFGSLSPSSTIIWKELACSPCVSVFNHRLSPCRNNVCMQEITVADVYGAVEKVLRGRERVSAGQPGAAGPAAAAHRAGETRTAREP